MDMDIDIDGCGMFMHVAIIECGGKGLARAIQAEARPHRRHIWAAILLVCVFAQFVRTLPASTWATAILVFGFWFWALVHGQIQLSVLEWEAYLFMGSVCWLSIWDFVVQWRLVGGRGW